MKKIILILVFLTINSLLFAQLYEISLDEKIKKSSLIVEGEVVSKRSFSYANEIWTANKIEVSKILKGRESKESKKVTIITRGGVLGDIESVCSHLLELNIGDTGLFFLHPSKTPYKLEIPTVLTYDVYSSSQGFFKYSINQSQNIIASEPFHQYDKINDLFIYIEKKTGEAVRGLNGNISKKRTGVRYVFKNFTISTSTIEFDIFVNGLYQNYNLYKSGIKFTYNDFFGQNISSSGLFQLTANEVANSLSYQLTTSDINSNKADIKLTTVGNVNGLNEITTQEKAFAHGKLTIVNPFVEPTLEFDINDIYTLNKYYDNISGQAIPFDTIIIEHEFKHGVCTPIIDSFDPKIVAGGIGQILTITGTCFGDYLEGVSKVEFLNAHEGIVPNDRVVPIKGDYSVDCSMGTIYCWSDTLIQIKIPSIGLIGIDTLTVYKYAGSPLFLVCNKEGLCDSPYLENLEVKYSVQNSWTKPGQMPERISLPVTLIDANELGGMSLTYQEDFISDTEIVDAFERALTTWKCATRVNFNADQNTSNTNDSILIRFGNLPAGTLAVTSSFTRRCKDDVTDIHYKADLVRFNITFNDSITWHKKEDLTTLDTTKHDFQTIALHELGHAHLLNHVNQTDDLMYYKINKGVERRTLNEFNIAGGNHIMNISAISYSGSDCKSPMNPVDTTGLDCYLINSISNVKGGGTKQLQLFPNPVTQNITFYLKIPSNEVVDVKIINLYGRVVYNQVFQRKSSELKEMINLAHIPNGMYILSTTFGSGRIISKSFLKL